MHMRFGSKGFSLVETMIALGIASIVGIGIATLALQTTFVQYQSSQRNELQRIHFVAMQTSRNIKKLSLLIGVTNAANLRNDHLDRCLVGRPKLGESCNGFARVITAPVETTVAESKTFRTQTIAEIQCELRSCPRVVVTIETRLLIPSASFSPRKILFSSSVAFAQVGGLSRGYGEGQGAGEGGGNALSVNSDLVRRSRSVLPGKTFAPVGQIEFTCSDFPNTNILNSVNLSERTGKCQPLPVSNDCPNGLPINDFGAALECRPPATSTCNDGIGNFGLYAGTVCGSGTGSPPVPTPIPDPCTGNYTYAALCPAYDITQSTFNNADCSALPRPNGSCTFRCQCGLPPTPPEPPPPQCGASGALSFNCATGETVDGVCGATEKSSYEQTNSAFCGASGPNNLSWVRMTCTPDPTCVGAPPPPPAPTPSDFACQFRRPFGWGGRSGSHCIEYFLSVVSPLPPPEDLRAGEHVAGRATYCNPSEGQCYGYFEAICQPDGSFQYTTLDCGQGLEP